mmetsp:Transcript_13858/g.33567  ORF Transcript_13858/g.33567 Transcript_13858/m.33567 type:complete len:294 (-) Transcript_13858:532-1413(-)
MKLTSSRLRMPLCIVIFTNALLMSSYRPASAFTPTSAKGIVSHRLTPPSCRQMQQLNSINESAKTSSAIDTTTKHPPSTDPSSTNIINTQTKIRIGEAQYSDLAQAANLMTDGFYPGLRDNPILRPIRYLMELDRLQGNFPYEGKDGRHFYLAAYEYDGEEGGGAIKTADGGRKLVGFCDIDGRIPKVKSEKDIFSMISPFATNVRRPQPYLSDLAVRADRRRRGIASSLMVEAERRARIMGFEELYLGVSSTNELALRMYSRIGYELIVPFGDMLAFLEVQKDVRMLRRSLD